MAETEEGLGFFSLEGDEVVPAPHAHGPWGPDMLHGRLLGALMARALELEHGEDGLHFTRLTVDLYRSTPLIPLRVETVRVRDGRRIRVADARITSAQGEVARASAVLLRRSSQPEGEVWAAPGWSATFPADLGPSPSRALASFDMWPLETDGSFGEATAFGGGRNQAWIRDYQPLVTGEALTPFVRVALAADLASPIAHMGTAGLKYINADYSIGLVRLPLGDVLGIEASGHLSEDGVAVGNCTLYDTSGPIGHCTTSALANGRVSGS